MTTPFDALADPTRRRILDLLRERPRLVGELAEILATTQPGISKHLRVLRDAGLVSVRQDAQRRWYELRTEPLVEIDAWLKSYNHLLSSRYDRLDAYLQEQETEMLKRTSLVLIAVASLSLAASPLISAQDNAAEGSEMTTGYAAVNGLQMYYEIHGSGGTPLVMLHGAYMNADLMREMVSPLSQTRQVIAVDLQAHGRTNDIADRPLTYEQMADDVAELMAEIGVEQADIFGYSMGGSTALQVAIRHPERVRKLVVASATYTSDGWHPDLHAMIETITPEMFIGSPIEEAYKQLAPNPENFPTLVTKLVALDLSEQDWSAESMQGIQAPTLLIAGDSDSVQLEHMVEMFKLLGGGVNGDLTGLPKSQLTIVPGATHTGVLMRVNLLVPMITDFLDAPLPA